MSKIRFAKAAVFSLGLCVAIGGAIASAHAEQKPATSPAPLRAVVADRSTECVGLLCMLTPNSMARPITASEAALMSAGQNRLAERARSAQKSKKKLVSRRLAKPRTASTSIRMPAIGLFGLTQPTVGWASYQAWLLRMSWSIAASWRQHARPFVVTGYQDPAVIDEPGQTIAPDFEKRIAAISKAGL